MDPRQYFNEHPKAALALSGGVDSTYLLWAALAAGADVRPYCVMSPFQPGFELEDAKRVCGLLGVPLRVIEVDVLRDAHVAQNPPDRCYYCKKRLFFEIIKAAAEDGYRLVLDGTNATDPEDDRPGMRAARELGVESPLRICGLGKQDVRRLAKEAGLFTWDKSAYACLATRVPTGTPLTREGLAAIDRGETALRGMGFSDFRLRVLPQGALLQLGKGQMELAARESEAIRSALAPDFGRVFLDLEPRGTKSNE